MASPKKNRRRKTLSASVLRKGMGKIRKAKRAKDLALVLKLLNEYYDVENNSNNKIQQMFIEDIKRYTTASSSLLTNEEELLLIIEKHIKHIVDLYNVDEDIEFRKGFLIVWCNFFEGGFEEFIKPLFVIK